MGMEWLCGLLLPFLILRSTAAATSEYFHIQCIDGETGMGVPLVLLRTGNYLQSFSDSAGNIAFYEPGMMEQPVFFSVLADGYNFTGGQQYPAPYDNGIVLTTNAGRKSTIVLNRTQLAQRMYRLTGAGLYRDSFLVGAAIPESAKSRAVADLSTGAFGQDTVMVASYKNQIFWVWGDTVCPRSARQNNCEQTGMYSVGATSCSPAFDAACSPSDPPALEYFAQQSPPGFNHPWPLAPIPPLNQNTWLSGLVVLGANTSSEALYAFYFKNPGDGGGAGPAARGIALWNDQARQFTSVSLWPQNSTVTLDKTVQILSPADANDGFVYFASNGVTSRVPASPEAMARPDAFELLPAWGQVPPAWGSGSVNWNAWTNRYFYLGAGDLGLYVGFSVSLRGPWVNGTLVASHARSGASCYNPLHLAHMDMDGGRIVSFACTYTSMWSNTIAPSSWTTCLFGLNSEQNCAPVVPRYEYNNLIYRLDLKLLGLL